MLFLGIVRESTLQRLLRATGVRQIVTGLNELERRGGKVRCLIDYSIDHQ